MSLITVEEQQTALQAAFAGITGIRTVSVDFPEAITDRDLPLLLFSPGDAEYSYERGSGSITIRRRWDMMIIVHDVTKGRSKDAERAAKPFLTRVPAALAAMQNVETADGDAFEVSLDGGGDAGVGTITYDNHTYLGCLVTFYTIVDDVYA